MYSGTKRGDREREKGGGGIGRRSHSWFSYHSEGEHDGRTAIASRSGTLGSNALGVSGEGKLKVYIEREIDLIPWEFMNIASKYYRVGVSGIKFVA